MKQVLPISLDVDEVALSLLGWEAVGFQARFMRERVERSQYYNTVTVAGELRFHPDDWQDRYNGTNLSTSKYLPDLIARVMDGRLDPGAVFDLTLPLAQVADGYAAMDERRSIKTMLAG